MNAEKAMKPQTATFESVWAALQETDRIMKENNLFLTQKQAETDRMLQESKAETDRQLRILTESIQKLNTDMGGMGNSNGDFAEEYFFNSFKNGRCTFFGEKFDEIKKNLHKGKSTDKFHDEYDIVLFNGKSAGIVEVKYKARIFHIDKIIDKVETFRVNFPKYANHQVYLGLASFVFQPVVEKECLKKGIAVIKQVGDTVVIRDKHLKVF